MIGRATTVLGIVLEERAILAAEVGRGRGGLVLRGAGQFTFAQGQRLDDPEALGRALRAFLNRNHLRATRTVIGVPASWTVTREQSFPPADTAAVAGMARMEAERALATGFDHFSVDAAIGPLKAGAQVPVFMCAIARERIEAVSAMARAAGLKALAVLPSSLAYSAVSANGASSGLSLFVRPRDVEMVLRSDGRFRALRHIPVQLDAADETAVRARLGEAVARFAASLPGEQAGETGGALTVWNGAGLKASALSDVGRMAGLRTDIGAGLAAVNVAPSSAVPAGEADLFATAAALAAAGLRRQALPVDFLHSRLEVRRKTRRLRRNLWIAAASVACAVAVLVFYLDWRAEVRGLAELRAREKDLSPEIDAAARTVQRISLARTWTDRRPRFLDPLREITLLLPQEAPLWITNMAVRQDMRGVISGKASDERSVLDFLDRLRHSRSFKDVELLYVRKGSTHSNDVVFSMTFSFVRKE